MPLTNAQTAYVEAKRLILIKYSRIKFFKILGSSGWRIGWILSNSKIIMNLIKLQSCIFTCPSTAGMELCNNLIKDKNINLDILDHSKNELENLFIEKG